MLSDHMPQPPQPVRTVSLESIDTVVQNANLRLEQFEHLAVTMEAIEEVMDDLELLIDSGDANATTARMVRERIDALAAESGDELPMPSLESTDGDWVAYHRASLESITGLWNRYKQLYVHGFQANMDAFALLFKGHRKYAERQEAKVSHLRQEWSDKKPSLTNSKHKSSLAGATSFAFVVNNKINHDPLGALATDYPYALHLNVTYQKTLAEYLKKVQAIFQGGKFNNDKAFESSVLSKLTALPHPSTLIKLPIVGQGNKLLYNYGLELKRGKTKKAAADGPGYNALAKLATQTYVKEYAFSWKDLKVAGLLHDIYFTTSDVDKLLDHCSAYSKLSLNAATTFKPLGDAFKQLAKLSEQSINTDALSPVNQKAFRQFVGFVGGLTRYSKNPYQLELKRINALGTAIRVLASRTIATAE